MGGDVSMALEERGLAVIDDLTEEGLHRKLGLLNIGLIIFAIAAATVELEEVLVAHLSAYDGLTALISVRIYPLILPQSPTLPALTYQRIDGPREHCMSEDAEVARPRIQIDTWAETDASAKAVATQVRTALQRWADATTSPVVLDSLLDNDEDSYEPDTNIYRVRQDWIIWHREET